MSRLSLRCAHRSGVPAVARRQTRALPRVQRRVLENVQRDAAVVPAFCLALTDSKSIVGVRDRNGFAGKRAR